MHLALSVNEDASRQLSIVFGVLVFEWAFEASLRPQSVIKSPMDRGEMFIQDWDQAIP